MFRTFRFKIEKTEEEIVHLLAIFLSKEGWCERQEKEKKWKIGRGDEHWFRTAGPYFALSYYYRKSAEDIEVIVTFLTELGATEIDQPPPM